MASTWKPTVLTSPTWGSCKLHTGYVRTSRNLWMIVCIFSGTYGCYKLFDTPRNCKNPTRALYVAVHARTIPLCSPHGVFTGCSWSINARGARKLIIHTSQLIWSRTYVTVWWISCPMQGSTNIVHNSLGTVRTGVMRMGHYLNTIGNLKIHGFMQYLGNLFLYNWIVVCGAVHWHGLLVLSMARSNFSYCSSPTVRISSWLLCGFGLCHW